MSKEKKLGPGDDAEMIDSPHLWPMWPVLPVKNYKLAGPGEFPETGIIESGNPTVVLVGLLGLTKWETAPQMKYNSIAELLQAGWIVD